MTWRGQITIIICNQLPPLSENKQANTQELCAISKPPLWVIINYIKMTAMHPEYYKCPGSSVIAKCLCLIRKSSFWSCHQWILMLDGASRFKISWGIESLILIHNESDWIMSSSRLQQHGFIPVWRMNSWKNMCRVKSRSIAGVWLIWELIETDDAHRTRRLNTNHHQSVSVRIKSCRDPITVNRSEVKRLTVFARF